jgi:hypothetical protein
MSEDSKKPKIIFAPGCFDHFEGSQEELDELIAEINRLVESGELFEKAEVIDLEELIEAELEDPDSIINDLASIATRKLQ